MNSNPTASQEDEPTENFDPQPQNDRDAFLAHFEPRRRSHVTNLFLNFGPRSNQCEPFAIVQSVLDVLDESIMQNYSPNRSATARDVKAILEAHPDDAVCFAEWAVRYHLLPDHERAAVKQATQQEHVNRWMANNPPSDKQLSYIRSLGYKGDVVSKLEASRIIEGLTAGRRK